MYSSSCLQSQDVISDTDNDTQSETKQEYIS